MNNIPLFTVDEYNLVNNTNADFIMEINTSNLQKLFKVHYIIENTDEYNVSEERCRPVFLL